MSFNYCRKHNDRDPWGCRRCLREGIRKIIREVNADLAKEIAAIFAIRALSEKDTTSEGERG